MVRLVECQGLLGLLVDRGGRGTVPGALLMSPESGELGVSTVAHVTSVRFLTFEKKMKKCYMCHDVKRDRIKMFFVSFDQISG